MKAEEITRHFNGFLWEALYEITPDKYIEPETEPCLAEVILGPMNELEKALFSIKFSLFANLLPFFPVNENDNEDLSNFHEWLIASPQTEFLDEYLKDMDADEKLLNEQELVLVLRSEFLAVHDFLEIITCQRFVLFSEDVIISYRKDWLVTTLNIRLVTFNEN